RTTGMKNDAPNARTRPAVRTKAGPDTERLTDILAGTSNRYAIKGLAESAHPGQVPASCRECGEVAFFGVESPGIGCCPAGEPLWNPRFSHSTALRVIASPLGQGIR